MTGSDDEGTHSKVVHESVVDNCRKTGNEDLGGSNIPLNSFKPKSYYILQQEQNESLNTPSKTSLVSEPNSLNSQQLVIDESKHNNISSFNDIISTTENVSSSSFVIDEGHASLCLSDAELETISKNDIISLYHRLQAYIKTLVKNHNCEMVGMKEREERVRSERNECLRREKVLSMRVACREREIEELEKEGIEMRKRISSPSPSSLRSTLLDPATHILIQKLKTELGETKKKLEDTQNDLNAWKFTPDSNTGKRLMAKCRMLYMENEDLGKQTSSGRIAKLENDLALNKQLVKEMKQSQAEMDEVVQELDEDIEGLQSAINLLQKQLRDATSDANNPGSSSKSTTPLLANFSQNHENLETTESSRKSLPNSNPLCSQCSHRMPTQESGFLDGESQESERNNMVDKLDSSPPSSLSKSANNGGIYGTENNSSSSVISHTNSESVVKLGKRTKRKSGGESSEKNIKLEGDCSSYNGNGSMDY